MGGISNNEMKHLRSLTQKKFRDEYGVFVVEGEKMVAEAMKSDFGVEKIYREEEIGAEAMSRISSLSSPPPVLATVRKPENMRLDTPQEISAALGSRGLFLAENVAARIVKAVEKRYPRLGHFSIRVSKHNPPIKGGEALWGRITMDGGCEKSL